VLGPDGLMSGPGAAPRVLVDCSTVSAEASARVRAEIAGRGTALLAAPVMGNPKVVRAGKMTAAVSGPRDAFDWRSRTWTCWAAASPTWVTARRPGR
jgi:3-hydroxyisobutyrate dehydrogenase and related beta-hydroxyacid dehydrogenases